MDEPGFKRRAVLRFSADALLMVLEGRADGRRVRIRDLPTGARVIGCRAGPWGEDSIELLLEGGTCPFVEQGAMAPTIMPRFGVIDEPAER